MIIEQQLKTLKSSHNPTQEVTDGIRSALTKRAHFLSSISHSQSVQMSFQVSIWQTLHFTFSHMRQVVAMFVVVAISAGGTLMAQASLAAVPGDTLYPIKRNLLEKVELVLAPTPQDEASVYLKHVATRLDEIRVLSSRDIPEEVKNEHINHTVLALNRDLTSARQSLKIAAKDKGGNPDSAAALVAVARGLTQSTSDVKVALAAAKGASQPSKGELSQSVTEAIASANEASADSLQILLDSFAKGSQDVARADLVEAVQQEITTVTQRVAVVEQSVIESGSQDVRLKVRQALYAQLNERMPLPFDLPTYDSLRTDISKAHKQLDEANRYLKLGNFGESVSWANQAEDTADIVAKTLDQASSLISLPLLPESEVPTSTVATSTSPIATTTAAVTVIEDPVGQLEVVDLKLIPSKK